MFERLRPADGRTQGPAHSDRDAQTKRGTDQPKRKGIHFKRRGARLGASAGDERRVALCRAFLRHRRIVIALFCIATAVSIACIPQVRVNYDIMDYLPADAPSTVAIDAMEDAYGTGTPNARLLAEGIDLAQADELSQRLSELPCVDEVMWLGTAIDIHQPLEIQDEKTVSSWARDDGYLFQLVVDQAQAPAAMEQVRAAAQEAGATGTSLEGFAVDIAYIQDAASVEIIWILAIAVVIVAVILLLVSHAWFEPVVYLTVIGVAICLNMGSNLVLGEISFISQICGAILQLAVSMDYAIVLFHTYRRCSREFFNPEIAMAHAMSRGFSVVLSSAAVTFFGFLSLTVMRFGIGPDMGVILAKGIVFSFVTIMLLMPCLLLACRGPLEASEHKPLVPSLARLARGCGRIMTPAAIVVILITVPCFLAESQTSFIYGTSNLIQPDSTLGEEKARINDLFEAEETCVLMIPEGQWGNEQALLDDIKGFDHVTGVTSFITVAGRAMPVEVVPESQLEQVISNGWSRLVITSDSGAEGSAAFALVENIRDAAQRYYGENYHLAGTGISTYDLRTTVQEDSLPVRMFTLGSIGLVLALLFRSLSLPVIMLASIEVSICINLAIPYFIGEQLNYIGYLVIDAIQMGAAVDYAIIYAREYLDQRRQLPSGEAARAAIEHSGLPILTSSSILVCAGVIVGSLSTIGLVSELGILIARGAFTAMLMMFLLLPWLLKTCDGLIRLTTLKANFYRKESHA